MDETTKQGKVQKMSVNLTCKSSEYKRKVICLTLGGLTHIGLR